MQPADVALRSWVLLAVTAPHLVSSDVMAHSIQQATWIKARSVIISDVRTKQICCSVLVESQHSGGSTPDSKGTA